MGRPNLSVEEKIRRLQNEIDARQKQLENKRLKLEERFANMTRDDRLRTMRKLIKRYHLNQQNWVPRLTSAEYEEQVKKQKGQCAICERVLPLFRDHDHKTGKKRALLCHTCNVGLGLLQDSIEVLSSALRYLKKWA